MSLIRRAFQQQRHALDDAFRPHGVTAAQVGVLTYLLSNPGRSGADVARDLLVSPQAAQVALTSLEKRGLVERRPDADHGRIVRTYLTREGERVARRCVSAGADLQNEVLSCFSRKERAQLVELLERMMEHTSQIASETTGRARRR